MGPRVAKWVSGKIECNFYDREGKRYRKLCKTLLQNFGPKMSKIALNIGQGSKWMSLSCSGWQKLYETMTNSTSKFRSKTVQNFIKCWSGVEMDAIFVFRMAKTMGMNV